MGFFGKLKDKIFGKTNKQSDKYVAALGKSRSNFADKLNALAARYRNIDEDYFDELEEILIEADVGVNLALDIIEATKKEVEKPVKVEQKAKTGNKTSKSTKETGGKVTKSTVNKKSTAKDSSSKDKSAAKKPVSKPKTAKKVNDKKVSKK